MEQEIEKPAITVQFSPAFPYHNSFFFEHRYIYKLEATTGGGSSSSDEHIVQTPVLTPEDIPPPHNITVMGPSSLFVAWNPPGKNNNNNNKAHTRVCACACVCACTQ